MVYKEWKDRYLERAASLTPSDFQSRCMQATKDLLASLNVAEIAFTPDGQHETYYFAVVSIGADEIKLYVYDDEAELIVGDDVEDWRFEKWDYSNSESLIHAFISKLKEIVKTTLQSENAGL